MGKIAASDGVGEVVRRQSVYVGALQDMVKKSSVFKKKKTFFYSSCNGKALRDFTLGIGALGKDSRLEI